MHPKIHWTASADAGLRRLRAHGVPWETIALALGLNRFTLIRHGMQIGARRTPPPPRLEGKPADPDLADPSLADPNLADPARGPLRAGHPLSWGLLTAGTVLAATRYPWPPVLEEELPAWARNHRGRAA